MSDLYYRFSNSMDIADKVAHLQKEASALQAAANIANSDAIREVAGLYASFAGCMAMLAKQLPYKKGDRIRHVRVETLNRLRAAREKEPVA